MSVEHTTTYRCDNCGREIVSRHDKAGRAENLGIRLQISADYWYVTDIPDGERGRYQRFDMLVCEECTGLKLEEAVAPVVYQPGGYGRPWDNDYQARFKNMMRQLLVKLGWLKEAGEQR